MIETFLSFKGLWKQCLCKFFFAPIWDPPGLALIFFADLDLSSLDSNLAAQPSAKGHWPPLGFALELSWRYPDVTRKLLESRADPNHVPHSVQLTLERL